MRVKTANHKILVFLSARFSYPIIFPPRRKNVCSLLRFKTKTEREEKEVIPFFLLPQKELRKYLPLHTPPLAPDEATEQVKADLENSEIFQQILTRETKICQKSSFT